MKGIVGRVNYLQALLKRYDPYETLGHIVEQELGLKDWRELTDPQEALADKHSAIHEHVEGRIGEGR